MTPKTATIQVTFTKENDGQEITQSIDLEPHWAAFLVKQLKHQAEDPHQAFVARINCSKAFDFATGGAHITQRDWDPEWPI